MPSKWLTSSRVPGGLAEGFAGYRDEQGQAAFEIALSVERERSAHRTLLLRAFLRKFGESYPSSYYTFLNDGGTEPNWAEGYPEQWDAAARETLRLEIGDAAANTGGRCASKCHRATEGEWNGASRRSAVPIVFACRKGTEHRQRLLRSLD